jgi:hypothetical protein
LKLNIELNCSVLKVSKKTGGGGGDGGGDGGGGGCSNALIGKELLFLTSLLNALSNSENCHLSRENITLLEHEVVLLFSPTHATDAAAAAAAAVVVVVVDSNGEDDNEQFEEHDDTDDKLSVTDDEE